MKHLTHLAALCACLTSFPVSAHVQEVMNEPDSVYLFSYATVNDAGRSGLKKRNMALLLAVERKRKRMGACHFAGFNEVESADLLYAACSGW